MDCTIKKISMNLPVWQIEFIDKYAKYSGMSRTSVIAMLIVSLAKDNNELLNLLTNEVSNSFFEDISESKKKGKTTESTKPIDNKVDSMDKSTKTEQSKELVNRMKINPMVLPQFEQPSEELTDNNVSENGKQENRPKLTESQDNEINSLNISKKAKNSIPMTANPMVIKPDIAKPKTFTPKNNQNN